MQTGRVADSLQRQLAKVLTEAEFAPRRAKEDNAADAANDSAADGKGSTDSNSPEGDGGTEKRKQDNPDDAESSADLAVSIRNMLDSIRAVQKHMGGAPDADQPDGQLPAEEPLAQEQVPEQQAGSTAALEADPKPDTEPEAEPARPVQDPPQPLHAGQQRRRAGGRGGGQRHGASKPRTAQAADVGHQAADAGSGATGASEKVYVDDETGEQFVLPNEVG